MASGLTPRLPITTSRYDLIRNYEKLVAQNLKMLILTVPGERMMDINFGVGLRRFLFERNDESTYKKIASTIRKQVSQYMPFVEVQKIEFKSPEDNPELYPHFIRTKITFRVAPLQLVGTLQLDTNTN